MTLEDYLKLPNPEEYDFTNDRASEEYQGISDTIEKHFVYMAINHHYKREDCSIMKKGADYSQTCRVRYGNILDPDSNSELLRQIYCILWSKGVLAHCKKKGGKIQGETMNSSNTTIGIYYENHEESLDEKKERNNLSPEQRVSIRYILSRYADRKEAGNKLFNDCPEIKDFLSRYHTLGNFIPVPAGCNCPRGFNNPKIEDYWDLTLRIIYEYFLFDKCRISDIVNASKEKKNMVLIEKYRNWLDSFGTWDAFIEDNYLQDFVCCCPDTSKFGAPKELWEGHFSSNKVFPERIEEIKQFYTNASSWILKRGKRMVIALEEKIQGVDSE